MVSMAQPSESMHTRKFFFFVKPSKILLIGPSSCLLYKLPDIVPGTVLSCRDNFSSFPALPEFPLPAARFLPAHMLTDNRCTAPGQPLPKQKRQSPLPHCPDKHEPADCRFRTVSGRIPGCLPARRKDANTPHGQYIPPGHPYSGQVHTPALQKPPLPDHPARFPD